MRLPLLLLAAACQAPIGADRHLLDGDRVAAITVTPPDGLGRFRAHAWLMVDGRPWSDHPVALQWVWLPDGVDRPSSPEALAASTGPAPLLQLPTHLDPTRLGLVATFPSGGVREAVLTLPAGGPTLLPRIERIDLAVVDGRTVAPADPDAPEEGAVALEARLGWQASSADHALPDRWARLTPAFAGPADRLTRVRWMATAGTFLELDAATADWAPADLVVDDDTVVEATPLAPGPVTVLALALDDAAGSALAAREVWVDPPPPGLVVAGRWLAADAEVGDARWVRGTLAADDPAPTGLRLEGAQALDEVPAGRDPFGTERLGCAAQVSGPFDPSWLLDARCLRREVVGQEVVVEVGP